MVSNVQVVALNKLQTLALNHTAVLYAADISSQRHIWKQDKNIIHTKDKYTSTTFIERKKKEETRTTFTQELYKVEETVTLQITARNLGNLGTAFIQSMKTQGCYLKQKHLQEERPVTNP